MSQRNPISLRIAALCGQSSRALEQQPTVAHPVQVVVFDLCGLLYDDSVWKRWLFKLLTHVGLHARYTPLFRLWDRDFQLDVWTGKRDFYSALKEFLRSTGLSTAQVEELLAAARPKIRSLQLAIRPFPGVASTLRKLATNNIELLVHSRAPIGEKEVENRLKQLGLEGCIHGLLGSTGTSVDCTSSFQSLLAVRHIPPASIAYVGCERSELQQARQLGLHTIAFNHSADALADQSIEQFDELIRRIKPTITRRRAAG